MSPSSGDYPVSHVVTPAVMETGKHTQAAHLKMTDRNLRNTLSPQGV